MANEFHLSSLASLIQKLHIETKFADGRARYNAAFYLASEESRRRTQCGANKAVEPLISVLKEEGVFNELIFVDIMGLGLIGGWVNLGTTVAYALGEIGDLRAVEPLIAVLRCVPYGDIHSIIRVLGALGDKRAVEPIMRHFKDTQLKEATRKALAKLLADDRSFGFEVAIAMLKLQDRVFGRTGRFCRSAAAVFLGEFMYTEALSGE